MTETATAPKKRGRPPKTKADIATIDTPQGVKYGYARVSTEKQDDDGYGLDIQIQELITAGVAQENIYTDTASGADRDRVALNAVLGKLKKGDTLVIPKLDRLARSMLHLLQIVEVLEERGVNFKSINDEGIDTSTNQGKFFFTIMGAVAEFERSMIRDRTSKGIRAKIAENIKETGRANWGRKGVSDTKLNNARDMLVNGKTHAEVAEITSISLKTLYRHFSANKIESLRLEQIAQKNKDNLDIFEDNPLRQGISVK